jgi:uncharacterized protein YydD (DUF2326 family)
MSMEPQMPVDANDAMAAACSPAALGHATQRAADLKARFQTAVHRSVALRDRLARLQAAMVSDRPPQRTDLQQLYSAAGVELPGVALRRFEDVEVFYDSVVANRRAHLATELRLLMAEAEEVEHQAVEADQARREILKMLDAN